MIHVNNQRKIITFLYLPAHRRDQNLLSIRINQEDPATEIIKQVITQALDAQKYTAQRICATLRRVGPIPT